MPETKMISVVLGPYRGQSLSVTAADFAKAIGEKWAVDPGKPPTDEPEPPLDPEQTAAAVESAVKWQAEQLEIASGNQPETGPNEQRDMTAERPESYSTRSAPATRRR